MRACLTRHIKQQKRASKGGSYHKAYYLAEHMKFLLPFTRSRSGKETSDFEVDEIEFEASVDSQKDTSGISESGTGHEGVSIDPQSTQRPKASETTAAATFTITTAEAGENQFVTFMQNAGDDQLTQVESVAISEAKAVDAPYAATTKTISLYEPEPKRVRVVSHDADDADLNFFRSLLPDVRMMDPSQKRRFKMGIFGLLDNVLTNSDINT